MEIQRNVSFLGNVWRRDTTHEAICDLFSSENEHHIYKRIQVLIGGNQHFGNMANLGFFRRLSMIFQAKNCKPLPEDLVLEILSRLPAEDVLKCLMVCKRWMTAILTPPFFYLHQTRAPLTILLENYDLQTSGTELYSLDLTHEKPCIRSFDTTKLLGRKSCLVGTCDGLLFSQHSLAIGSFYLKVCNPLTGTVVTEVTIEANNCHGFWFHPFKKEYMFLTISDDLYGRYCYKIFNLRGESTILGRYECIPSNVPVNIRCSLYYLLLVPHTPENCIMIFNIETERIDFKPHPHSDHCYRGHAGFSWSENGDMQLLEMEESLAFAHVCLDTNSLHLWMLVDRETWHWLQRYKINLNWHGHRVWPVNRMVYPLGVQEGEMLMLYRPDRLIALNLETRRIRKIDLNTVSVETRTSIIPTTYRSSLVGLYRLANI